MGSGIQRIWFSGLALALLLLAGNAQGAKVLFILDGSGSMWGRVDGQPKIEIARKVLVDLINDLPASVDVGLEAYGHNRKNDCTDIEILAPVGSDRAAVTRAVLELNPQGMTPLTEAIRKAAMSLRETEDDTSIIVVSDGKETCEGDPCAIAAEVRRSVTNVRIHVVGFDVTPEEAAQLNCIAENGGGKYFGAKNAAELVAAFAEVKAAVVAEPEPEPEPEPVPVPVKKEPSIYFRDDFDGNDLDTHWEVLNPNVDMYIVEEGELLTLNSSVGAFGDGSIPNIFRLSQPIPSGDWVATMKISVDFQSGVERIFFGLYEDGQNYLINLLSTVGGSCLPGGSYSFHLNASPLKMSAGTPTTSSREIWTINRCDGGKLSDKMNEGQPILMRLEKKGRSYTSAVKMQGIEQPVWVELDKLTLLKPKGGLSFGVFQSQNGAGETSLSVDWIQIETLE